MVCFKYIFKRKSGYQGEVSHLPSFSRPCYRSSEQCMQIPTGGSGTSDSLAAYDLIPYHDKHTQTHELA